MRMMNKIVSDAPRLTPLTARIPHERLPTPQEVAETIYWLLSYASSYVNGNTLTVHGGETTELLTPKYRDNPFEDTGVLSSIPYGSATRPKTLNMLTTVDVNLGAVHIRSAASAEKMDQRRNFLGPA